MPRAKQWKQNGEEDNFITKLISEGKITRNTKPSSLKSVFPTMFADFSPNVIRNHLNVLKMRHGLNLVPSDEEDGEDIDSMAADMAGNVPANHFAESFAKTEGSVTNIHHNYPVLCEMYKEPENQLEKVVVAVSLPGGAQNVRVEVSEDGMQCLVKYGWPKTMYTMDDLFRKQLENKVNIVHPKVICFQVRQRIDAIPDSVIKVNLPIKVQTAIDSWTKGGAKRDDGTNMAYAEFQGYVKEYNKKTSESQLILDM
ncbi:hypothetical protein Bhyg_03205 [Pseudolycoriella hygida]|uniref:Uncharacterized protein n=1 Tax=Pseudolycoriella hygida TaxID=35572 RepID=A0A9Q0S9A7_9DIPT|nr:hypothetical protein Bhyg_03205 [Pseudolycoriella hygida]